MPREPSPLELLKLQIEAGADEAIGDDPVNRLAAAEAARAPAPAVPPARSAAAPLRSPAAPPPVRGAEDITAACTTVDELVAAIRAFDGCVLKETATSTVIYDGNPRARIMVVGEAPGGEEDRRGLPFVGPAGRLLDRMLAAIDLDRDQACISNMIFWRPPGNRSPTVDEIAICMPFTRRLIELVAPEVLVFVGGISAKAMFGRSEGITRLRGVWHRYASPGLDEPVDAIATFHPAYLLRQPLQKREVWRDLLSIKARLDITAADS